MAGKYFIAVVLLFSINFVIAVDGCNSNEDCGTTEVLYRFCNPDYPERLYSKVAYNTCVSPETENSYCVNGTYDSYSQCPNGKVCQGGDKCVTPSVCGNNIKETGEICDGSALDGKSCQTFGFSSGTLKCKSDCSEYDKSSCSNNPPAGPVCGNNIKETGEICDGTALDEKTCQSFGFSSGTLKCKSDCLGFDTSSCSSNPPVGAVCGNNVKETGEICDGSALDGKSCLNFYGYNGGTLRCKIGCEGYDLSLCTFNNRNLVGENENNQEGNYFESCGNGAIDFGEVCDSKTLRDATCESFGYDGGVLKCGEDCKHYDLFECVKSNENNSLNNAGNKKLLGCVVEGRAYAFGYRLNGTFCSATISGFAVQGGFGQECSEDYECDNNKCVEGICAGGGLLVNFMKFVWEILSKIFG